MLAIGVGWGCGGDSSLRFEETDYVRLDRLEIRDIVVFVTETTATLRWQSRRASVGWVVYGAGSDLDQQSPPEAQAVTQHDVTLTSLSPATRYLFRVAVETPDGKTFRSEVYSFHTLGVPLGKIAVISDREGGSALYVMRGDGTNPRRLVEDASQPDWSPDGTRLVFVSRRAGSSDLWLINADGTGLQPLTATPDLEEWSPAWSPDGRKVLYAAAGSRASRSELYLLALDDLGNPTRLTTNPFLDEDPDWSPDGQRIVWVSTEGTAAIELAHRPVMAGSVEVRDRAGRVIPATEWTLLADAGVLDFSGSAGGTGEQVQVSYQSLDGEGGSAIARDESYNVPLPNREIFVMNVEGSGRQRLTRNEAADFSPAWSPNGDRILFVSDRDRNTEIYLMNTDGSSQTNLTGDQGGDLYPSWSPDGSAYTWVARRFGLVDLYRRNLDGSGLENITRFTSGEGEPVWGP